MRQAGELQYAPVARMDAAFASSMPLLLLTGRTCEPTAALCASGAYLESSAF